MIPVEKMQFTSNKDKNGDTRVDGSITFQSCYFLSQYEVKAAKIDLIKIAERDIRRQLWHKTYDELFKPMRELEYFALKYAPPPDCHRVQELISELRKLLEYPQ